MCVVNILKLSRETCYLASISFLLISEIRAPSFRNIGVCQTDPMLPQIHFGISVERSKRASPRHALEYRTSCGKCGRIAELETDVLDFRERELHQRGLSPFRYNLVSPLLAIGIEISTSRLKFRTTVALSAINVHCALIHFDAIYRIYQDH